MDGNIFLFNVLLSFVIGLIIINVIDNKLSRLSINIPEGFTSFDYFARNFDCADKETLKKNIPEYLKKDINVITDLQKPSVDRMTALELPSNGEGYLPSNYEVYVNYVSPEDEQTLTEKESKSHKIDAHELNYFIYPPLSSSDIETELQRVLKKKIDEQEHV
jgi:hypothetical protein